MPVQTAVENLLKRYHAEGRWNLAVLFSSDGFQMARIGEPGEYDDERLLEIAFSLREPVRTIGDPSETWEIMIRKRRGERLVITYFESKDEPLVLAIVIQGKKGYRRALQKVRKTIRDLM